MAQIFCIANQKGGVGKTTTAVNLAGALALKGRRVLFIDLDPQGNGTMGCGIEKRDLKGSIYEVLLGIASFEQAVCHSTEGGFDVLPANRELAGAEVELVGLIIETCASRRRSSPSSTSTTMCSSTVRRACRC